MSEYSDYLKTLGTWSGTREEWNESLFNAGMTKAAEIAEAALADAAGINSIHNACQFRADCRKAEAEIARLRENVAPVISSRASGKAQVAGGSTPSEQTRRCEWCGEIAQGECGCAAETEIARLREMQQSDSV